MATIYQNVVTVSGLGSVSAGESVNFWLPNGNKIALVGSLTFYYLKDGADPSNKMILYTNSISEPLFSFSSALFSSASITSPSGAAYTVGGSSTTTASLKTPWATTISNYVGIGLSPGFTLPSSYTLTIGSTTLTPVYGVSSSSSSFAGGFVIGLIPSGSSVSLNSSTATSLTLSSLNAPPTTGASEDGTTAGSFVVYATGIIGAACYSISTISSIKVSAATITSDTCSMDKLYTKGSDSVDSTLTLTFATVNPVTAGGMISIVLSDSFTVFTSSSTIQGTTCQGVGFTDYSADYPQKCVISSSTITLSQFSQIPAGVVTVKVFHIIPSSTTTTSLTCFTSVNTYHAATNGYLIDSMTSGITNAVTVAASTAAGTTSTD
ncbi:unnamed protein product [Blepharisma stoltei]|uniref:Uncharacterized protein n=1 Tax=Blepharisma stoltei TaxID=1481888 RepID=A0AAU9IGF4_9CILI|nr:unnamed protein product [Blepharisma stoltei]